MALGSGEEAPTPGARRDYLKLVMALCCISAVAIAGTTYESTLNSDPDEIIDVKHEWLPIGKDPIRDFKNPESSASSAGGGGGGGEETPPCTGGVVGILANLFPSLIPPCGLFYLLGLFLPVLVLLGLVGLLYRYRHRLMAPALAVRAWFADVTGRSDDGETPIWPTERPPNDVHRAWVAMVERANVDRPRVRSPRECARAALETDMESDAVESVTTLFEDDRYGEVPVPDERRERAAELHQEFTDGTGRSLIDGDGRSLVGGRVLSRLPWNGRQRRDGDSDRGGDST